MKASLIFDLPSEQRAYSIAINGERYKKALEMVSDYIDQELEKEEMPIAEYTIYKRVKEKMSSALNGIG